MLTTIIAALSPTANTINTTLNPDILWWVFWENTDVFEGIQGLHYYRVDRSDSISALITLLRTSQVCRLWREIVLSSSVLWGRVIDLNILLWQRRDHWRGEVMKRAAHAPLHIAGTLRMESKASQLFFRRLLHERWSSIRRLCVAVPKPTKPVQFTPDDMWDPMQRPSPLLETCRIFFEDETSRIPDVPLFADTAPALHDFSLYHRSRAFSLQVPWLNQLQELDLKALRVDVVDFVVGLSNMPFLEHLRVKDLRLDKGVVEHSTSKVSLESLKTLEFKGTCRSLLFLLKTISLSRNAVLLLEVGDFFVDGRLSHEQIQDMCHEISRYMTNYLENVDWNPTSLPCKLDLLITSHQFSFDLTRSGRSRSTHEWMFSFDFKFSTVFTSNLFKALLDHRQFARLETFYLMALSRNNDQDGITLEQFRMIGSIWSSFSSVTTLGTWCECLYHLLAVQSIFPEVFPSLQTLILVDMKGRKDLFLQKILRFITVRRRPIAEVRLPGRLEDIGLATLEPLDVIQGLKITWDEDDEEYICGSEAQAAD